MSTLEWITQYELENRLIPHVGALYAALRAIVDYDRALQMREVSPTGDNYNEIWDIARRALDEVAP